MAHVGSFSSRSQAELAAGMLVAHGIRAVVAGDDAGGIAPHVTFISGGGYALSVRAEDVDEARTLLAGGTDDPDASDALPRLETARPVGSVGRTLVLRIVLRAALAAFVVVVLLQTLARGG